MVQKSQHRFSKMSLDQNHEQENEMIKGDGGAVGLTESPMALRRWMVSGLEIARLVKESEATFDVRHSTADTRHHEQVPSVQANFGKHVKAMVVALEEFGNSFMESSKDLIVIDSKEIMPNCVVESIYEDQKNGEVQYKKYVEERLEKTTAAVSDTIERNLSINLKLQHAPPGQSPGILTFEIAVVCPWDKIAGQMPGQMERV